MSVPVLKDQADLERRRRDYLAIYGVAVCETDGTGNILRVLDPAKVHLQEPPRVRNGFGWAT